MEQNEHTILPPAFLSRLRQLEEAYLMSDDPIRQSGFAGGPERWRREREPILEAFQEGGDLLDACCANGYLLECLMHWGKARGLEITPFGIDQGSRLIELARRRLPRFADHFQIANAWDWHPPRRYRYVYTLWDCVPEGYLTEFVRRLAARFVAPGGRLILGAYGSLSRNQQPFDVEMFLSSAGYQVSGTASGGDPPVSRFAWIGAGDLAAESATRPSCQMPAYQA
jgi:SAM-dependent methyltransferase